VLDTTAGSTPGVPSGLWRPADGTGPTLVAAHPLPPLPLIVDEWSAGIDWVARQCVGADVILHVLVGSAWSVRGFEVRTDFDDAGSDHRPVVAVLARR
jgi:hypothetical protein